MRTCLCCLLLIASGAALCGDAAQDPALKRIGFDQKLNAVVPLDLKFRDESGQPVLLNDYFHAGRPVILVLGYYGCPMLCGAVLHGMTTCLKLLPLNPGSDFEIVMVSIDPNETPQLAAQKKAEYVKEYKRPETAGGWHFLTGEQPQIDQLTRVAGFRYFYDEHAHQYAHASGIVLVTPAGNISRYFLGIEYPARDVRLSLVEASQNQIGAVSDQFLLLCYSYNPATGRYGFAIMNAVRIGGALTVLALASFVVISLWRERKRRHGEEPLLPRARSQEPAAGSSL